MDVRFINPFIEAVDNVLSTMAGVEPKTGKPYLKKHGQALGDISGIIGITGDAIGSLSITFTGPCIQGIVSKMLGTTYEEVSPEVRDAVGEITNMICGDARRRLQKDGINLSGAIPTIVAGKGHSVRHVSSGPILVIPFDTDQGPFVIEVALSA